MATGTGKGINENLIGDAITAITNYKNKLNARLDEFKTEVTFDTALIGDEQVAAINNYYSRVMDKVKEAYEFLDSFGENVEKAAESYKQEEAAIASALNS